MNPHARLIHRLSILLVVSCFAQPSTIQADELKVLHPKPFQVLQRQVFPSSSDEYPKGFCDAQVRLAVGPIEADEQWLYRLAPDAQWQPVRSVGFRTTTMVELLVRIPAGGWYRLELEMRLASQAVHHATCDPIGVGELFLVAGQSYATNCNDELLQVNDPSKRVTAFDLHKQNWRVADDPQPCPDQSDGGSIWPALGDLLTASWDVPVGFANAGVGATSSDQWQPGGTLHQTLCETGKVIGPFRALLWQQGESDVIQRTSTEKYVANIERIRKATTDQWECQPLWYLAKSTHHPTVYDEPNQEEQIRQAVDQLANRPRFRGGPDTDSLRGSHRGALGSRRHFTGQGQRAAAQLWSQTLSVALSTAQPAFPAADRLLASSQLWVANWESANVHRESSVLLHDNTDAMPTARLAFPAAQIDQIRTATSGTGFAPGRFALSDDGLTLSASNIDEVPLIQRSDFFLDANAPHSYRHRVGNSEQWMMYRPGRWFQDRQIEISYTRRPADRVTSSNPNVTPLPRTLERLKNRQPIIVGVSGDSISTGADASLISLAAPYQPGYADLVAAAIEAEFDSPVTLHNRAVGGWSVANGVSDLDNLLQHSPHLVIVAYGMNDVGRRDPAWYGDQTKQIVDRIQKRLPDSEIILVATMQGNADWIHTPPEMFALYRDELHKLVGPGVALADLTEVWRQMLAHKHHHDMTGNGLNHPNDFGHRLYAQAVLKCLNESTSD